MRFTAISGLVFAALLQVGQQPGVTNPPGVASSLSAAAFPLLAPGGSHAAPSYAFSNDVDAGLSVPFANSLDIGVTAIDYIELDQNQIAWTRGGFQTFGATQSSLIIGQTTGAFARDRLALTAVLAGAGSFQGQITSLDLTATRTWTLPDYTGAFSTTAGATVASASNIDVLGANVVHISGSTNIDSVTIHPAGRCVSLIFDGVLTVNDASNLKLVAAFVTTADDTLSLCSDGSNWYETARSVN